MYIDFSPAAKAEKSTIAVVINYNLNIIYLHTSIICVPYFVSSNRSLRISSYHKCLQELISIIHAVDLLITRSTGQQMLVKQCTI